MSNALLSTHCGTVRLLLDRSCCASQDFQELSRFSRMLFFSVRGFLDYAGPNKPLAFNVVVVLPSSFQNGVGILYPRLFEAQ